MFLYAWGWKSERTENLVNRNRILQSLEGFFIFDWILESQNFEKLFLMILNPKQRKMFLRIKFKMCLIGWDDEKKDHVRACEWWQFWILSEETSRDSKADLKCCKFSFYSREIRLKSFLLSTLLIAETFHQNL